MTICHKISKYIFVKDELSSVVEEMPASNFCYCIFAQLHKACVQPHDFKFLKDNYIIMTPLAVFINWCQRHKVT